MENPSYANYKSLLEKKTEEEYSRVGNLDKNNELLGFYKRNNGKLEFIPERMFDFLERFRKPGENAFQVFELMGRYYLALKQVREILEDKV